MVNIFKKILISKQNINKKSHIIIIMFQNGAKIIQNLPTVIYAKMIIFSGHVLHANMQYVKPVDLKIKEILKLK